MSYSDEWLKAVRAATTERNQRVCACPEYGDGTANIHHADCPKPVEPVASTTWKPWAKMTAEERRKALEKREEKP